MNNKQKAAIAISEKDNVATAISELKAGDSVAVRVGEEERKIILKSTIKFLHKFALENMEKGQHIIKYGQIIGETTKHIKQGEHVHVHNLRSLRGLTSD